jgi:peptidylprolyl isomerase
MKKFWLVVALFIYIPLGHSATDEIISAANSLAEYWYIVNYSTDIKKYNLGKPILRQEAIWIVTKISGVAIGDSSKYTCNNKFLDVTKEDWWICYVAERAASTNTINWQNTKFRPKDNMTHYEAMILALKANCIQPIDVYGRGDEEEQVFNMAISAGLLNNKSLRLNTPILRGEFFNYILKAQNYKNNNSDKIDESLPGCVDGFPKEWDSVDVEFIWTLDNGEIFDWSEWHGWQSYQFYLGQWHELKEFEDAILSMKIGERKKIQIKAENAFGEEYFFESIPREEYDQNTTEIKHNQEIYLETESEVIYKVRNTHPLAGKDLNYEIELININRWDNTDTVETLIQNTTDPIKTKAPVSKDSTPINGDIVTVHYVGTLEDGTVFDSSRVKSRSPFEFTIGNKSMIEGFEKAVSTMKVGETKKVLLAPEDAYGEEYLVETKPISEYQELITIRVPVNGLIGKLEQEMGKYEAQQLFESLTIGTKKMVGKATLRIVSVTGDVVIVSIDDPKAPFYGKEIKVGMSTVAEDGSHITIKKIISSKNIEVDIRSNQEIISKTSTEVTLKLKNPHPLAGQALNFEIELLDIKRG